jgi:proliferating cell nuclear antigen
MAFKAKVKADILKEIINVVSTLVDEVKVHVAQDGVSLKAVDPAHVAMVELKIGKDAFEELKATSAELGVDIEKLKDVLKLAKAGDMLTIEHNEDQNKLVLVIANITRKMALVDTTGMSDPKVPNLQYPTKVVLSVEDLNQGIRASESVSDHIALRVAPDGFELACEGDTDSVSLKLKKDLVKSLDAKEAARSLFSLDYFSNMVRAIPAGQEVTLHLGNDYPVRVEFKIADGDGQVMYLLAPRIESE